MSEENTAGNANPPAVNPERPVQETSAANQQSEANQAEGTPQGVPPNDGLLGNQESKEGTGDDKSEKPENESKDENPTIGAPEDGYKFDQLPEGTDQSVVEAWKTQAKELNLSQEASQKMLSAGIEGLKAKFQEQRSQLREAALADKDLDYAHSGQVINKAYETYVKPNQALAQKLAQYNLDVDPDFIRFLKAVGKDVSEGGFVQGNRSDTKVEGDYRDLYPATSMNR